MNLSVGINTAVILAGGENRRFPMLKSFIEVDGSPIIKRNICVLKKIFHEVFINTNMPERYFYIGVPLIGDVLPSRGPMSGIYSSLVNAKEPCIFVTACDMPFLDKDVITFICEKHVMVSKSGTVDATIPIFNNEPQPLAGVYSKTILPFLEEGVLNDKVSLKRLLNDVLVNFIDEADVRAVDPEGRSFININTVEDCEKWFSGHSYNCIINKL
ncbi:MAG: molybdenum cofactor guanylyltransferase [Nitrospirae bacterium]|nr:molybdenum cofactor guanylyltransferase [Nitrospirota bacterium]